MINSVIIEAIRVPCGNTGIAEQMKRLAFVRLQWRPLDLVAQRSTQLSVPYEATNRTQSMNIADPTQKTRERSGDWHRWCCSSGVSINGVAEPL
jgi:hypothetical protein